MIIPLTPSRSDLAALHRFFLDPKTPWVSLDSLLSTSGKERWAVVLALRHPVLPWRQLHIDSPQPARGHWASIEGVWGAIFQARVVHREHAPVSARLYMAPPVDTELLLQPYTPQHASAVVSAWLDHAAERFQAWEPPQQQRAHQHAALSARLSGVAWSLLAGRAKACDLLLPEDLA